MAGAVGVVSAVSLLCALFWGGQIAAVVFWSLAALLAVANIAVFARHRWRAATGALGMPLDERDESIHGLADSLVLAWLGFAAAALALGMAVFDFTIAADTLLTAVVVLAWLGPVPVRMVLRRKL